MPVNAEAISTEIDTDSDRLLSPEIRVGQTNRALAEVFPDLQNNLVVMVETDEPADARAAAEELAAVYCAVDGARSVDALGRLTGLGEFETTKAIFALIQSKHLEVCRPRMTGGMESMTNAPYLLQKARGGLRMGHGEVLDHMFTDGLQSPYDQKMMGMFGESCAERYGFSRSAQDGFAVASIERAQKAVHEGLFQNEITPVTVRSRRSETVCAEDEEPHRCNIGKVPELRPAFKKDGTVTAGNASKISDGAAATVLMTAEEAERRGLQPLARIVAHATYAHEPEWFTTAPSAAVAMVVEKAGWTMDEVDLFEINEAFASVTMAAMADNGLDHDKVNVNGGACALGHPIGASGARILVTLVHALRQRGLKRGVASLCLGGGEAVAVAVEV